MPAHEEETELHALIRHRCDFGLAEKQNEVDALKGENRVMKKNLRQSRQRANRRKARKRRRSGG